jgi:hypothetical protein
MPRCKLQHGSIRGQREPYGCSAALPIFQCCKNEIDVDPCQLFRIILRQKYRSPGWQADLSHDTQEPENRRPARPRLWRRAGADRRADPGRRGPPAADWRRQRRHGRDDRESPPGRALAGRQCQQRRPRRSAPARDRRPGPRHARRPDARQQRRHHCRPGGARQAPGRAGGQDRAGRSHAAPPRLHGGARAGIQAAGRRRRHGRDPGRERGRHPSCAGGLQQGDRRTAQAADRPVRRVQRARRRRGAHHAHGAGGGRPAGAGARRRAGLAPHAQHHGAAAACGRRGERGRARRPVVPGRGHAARRNRPTDGRAPDHDRQPERAGGAGARRGRRDRRGGGAGRGRQPRPVLAHRAAGRLAGRKRIVDGRADLDRQTERGQCAPGQHAGARRVRGRHARRRGGGAGGGDDGRDRRVGAPSSTALPSRPTSWP